MVEKGIAGVARSVECGIGLSAGVETQQGTARFRIPAGDDLAVLLHHHAGGPGKIHLRCGHEGARAVKFRVEVSVRKVPHQGTAIPLNDLTGIIHQDGGVSGDDDFSVFLQDHVADTVRDGADGSDDRAIAVERRVGRAVRQKAQDGEPQLFAIAA